MKLGAEKLDRIATLLVRSYRDHDLMVAKAEESVLKNKIVDVIAKNLAEEEAIEEEARKMLVSFGGGRGDLDPYKMFLLAKQKLAVKRGFIL
jgi:hypothetical protein